MLESSLPTSIHRHSALFYLSQRFILMPLEYSNLVTTHAKTSCFIKHWPYSSKLGIFAQSASFTVSSKVTSEKARTKATLERRRFHDNVADIDWLMQSQTTADNCGSFQSTHCLCDFFTCHFLPPRFPFDVKSLKVANLVV
jgi:hypothetical protein